MWYASVVPEYLDTIENELSAVPARYLVLCLWCDIAAGEKGRDGGGSLR